MPESEGKLSANDVLVEVGVVDDLRSDAAQALLLLGELRWLTKWDDATLCKQLGCDLDRWMDVGGARRRDPDRISRSLEFLSLVRDVTRTVDLTNDRRDVVNAAFQLCEEAGGPSSERIQRVRAALDNKTKGELAPLDLLSLGEIGRAWRAAALNMQFGPAYERAVAATHLVGAVVAQTAHMSPERLELLATRNAEELLGGNVARVMGAHLVTFECKKCAALAESLGLGDLLRPRELPQAAAA